MNVLCIRTMNLRYIQHTHTHCTLVFVFRIFLVIVDWESQIYKMQNETMAHSLTHSNTHTCIHHPFISSIQFMYISEILFSFLLSLSCSLSFISSHKWRNSIAAQEEYCKEPLRQSRQRSSTSFVFLSPFETLIVHNTIMTGDLRKNDREKDWETGKKIHENSQAEYRI